MKKDQILQKGTQVVSLLTCVLIVFAVALRRDHKVLGIKIGEEKIECIASGSEDGAHKKDVEAETQYPIQNDSKGKHIPVVRDEAEDGQLIVSTRDIAKDVIGYAGQIVLDIYIKEGKVTRVVAVEHTETPSFFESVEEAGLLASWDGLTIDEALSQSVDAVSGATYSSDAVITSVARGLTYYKGVAEEEAKKSAMTMPDLSIKFFSGLIVLLCAIVLPFFVKGKRYRLVQLILNVVVLGFWTGTFLSYTVIVNAAANGVRLWGGVIPLLLLIVAFVLPLFGRKSHYCNHVCPMGALQELVGKSVRYKLKINPRVLKGLSYFRDGLWVVLMLLMLCGVLFEWMEYEVFSAFLFDKASVPVLIIAIVFAALSSVVWKPYCRFVCPTGTLMRWSQRSK